MTTGALAECRLTTFTRRRRGEVMIAAKFRNLPAATGLARVQGPHDADLEAFRHLVEEARVGSPGSEEER